MREHLRDALRRLAFQGSLAHRDCPHVLDVRAVPTTSGTCPAC